MAHRLACEAEGTFAAAAPIAAPLWVDPLTDCDPARAIPTFTVQGDTDQLIPYGGGNLYPAHPDSPLLPVIPSAAASFQRWQDINGCTDTPTTTNLGAFANCDEVSVCTDGVKTTLCTVRGVDMIGAPPVPLYEHVLYVNLAGIDLARESWLFMRQFSRPQPNIAGTWQVTALCEDSLASSVLWELSSSGSGAYTVDRPQPCGQQSVFGEGLVPITSCSTRDPLTCADPNECSIDGSYDAQGTVTVPTDPSRFVPANVLFDPISIAGVPTVCGDPWTLAEENTMSRLDGVIRRVVGIEADVIGGVLTRDASSSSTTRRRRRISASRSRPGSWRPAPSRCAA